MELLDCVEVEPKEKADSAVIWLHGLGANGHDFEPIIPQLKLPDNAAIRFVFPHAPAMPVTVNHGLVMPAWYDTVEIAIDAVVDVSGIHRSSVAIEGLIEREIKRGVKSENIVLIGFSQGGAVVYECGLSYSRPLAGILALSSYFATHETVSPNKANGNTPVAIHHGLHDHVIPELLGRDAEMTIRHFGNPVEYKSYDMEHSVCAEQIDDISDWLTRVLASD